MVTLSRVSWFLSPSKYSHLKIDTSKSLPHSCDFIESDSIYSNGYFHLSGGLILPNKLSISMPFLTQIIFQLMKKDILIGLIP